MNISSLGVMPRSPELRVKQQQSCYSIFFFGPHTQCCWDEEWWQWTWLDLWDKKASLTPWPLMHQIRGKRKDKTTCHAGREMDSRKTVEGEKKNERLRTSAHHDDGGHKRALSLSHISLKYGWKRGCKYIVLRKVHLRIERSKPMVRIEPPMQFVRSW